jgi:predicted extracellular nuclease
MKRFMCDLLGVLGLLAAVPMASAGMFITEWMYDGNAAGQEFIEFTNVGAVPIDMTGWSFDDDSRVPGTVDLSPFGVVQPGQSVILAESSAADFDSEWGLSGVSIIGDNTTNLGRNDEINLFDAGGALVDRLTYGDQNYPGTIRTKGVSGNPGTPAALGMNDVSQWVLSYVGDTFGSYTSVSANIGNPGVYVPEPTAALALGLLVLLVRRPR